MKSFKEKLKELGACQEAIEWVGDRTKRESWEECKRADWMLWYVFRARVGTKRDRILAVCACARMALKYVPEGEDRPRFAIEATELYAEEPTKENRKLLVVAREAAGAARSAVREAAREAVRKAGWAAEEARAAWAAYCAAGAAKAASKAASKAGWAAWVAYFAAEADEATLATRAARKAAHREMCRIIREKIKLKGEE